MTPVTFFAAFCVAMAAIAVGRVGRADEYGSVDVGTALLVAAIAAFALAWANLQGTRLPIGAGVLSAIGVAFGGAGLALLLSEW